MVIAVILGALLAAILIGVGVVFFADRFARSKDDHDEDVSPPPHASRSTDEKNGQKDVPTAVGITASPGRHCLLAFRHAPTGGDTRPQGACTCMRDTVELWQVSLTAPLVQFVSDDGCAIFFDRPDESMAVTVRTVDVAGIERFREAFDCGFLEYGGDISGDYVWAVTEGLEKAGELIVWSLEQGRVVLRCEDPRLQDREIQGQVASLFIQGTSALVQFAGGRGLNLPLAGEVGGSRRPDTSGPAVEII